MHEVFDGRALSKKFRIAHHGEARVGARLLTHQVFDDLAGTNGDRALGDDDLVAVEVLADGRGHLTHEAEVCGAIGAGGSAHGDEDDLGGLDGGTQLCGEAEAPGGHVFAHQGGEAWLIDGDLPPAEGLNFGPVLVYSDNIHAEVGQTGAGYQADVTASYNADIHVLEVISMVVFVGPPQRRSSHRRPSRAGASPRDILGQSEVSCTVEVE